MPVGSVRMQLLANVKCWGFQIGEAGDARRKRANDLFAPDPNMTHLVWFEICLPPNLRCFYIATKPQLTSAKMFSSSRHQVGFMAPEVARCHHASPASDIW